MKEFGGLGIEVSDYQTIDISIKKNDLDNLDRLYHTLELKDAEILAYYILGIVAHNKFTDL